MYTKNKSTQKMKENPTKANQIYFIIIVMTCMLARISLTLSLHVSLSFIAFGRSSELHPVSSHSCCMNVRAGRPAFDWPYAGVHRSTSLTISSLLLKQCPACLVRLACIVFMIGGRWSYSWHRVGCCCQDLFNIARNKALNNLQRLICHKNKPKQIIYI